MKSLLLILSKTDKRLLDKCPKSTSLHQQALGFLVLLTAIFAFISSYYALSTVFGTFNPHTRTYELDQMATIKTALISLAYSLFIGAIDREIVSSKSFIASFLRLPMAIMIGVIIAVPMELKILEQRIDKQLFMDNIKENQQWEHKRDAILDDVKSAIKKKELIKDYYRTNLVDWTKKKHGELIGTEGDGFTGKSGPGRVYKDIRENIEKTENEIKLVDSEINILKEEYREKKADLDNMVQNNSVAQTYDLWSRYNTMKKIVREDESGAAEQMALGITFLFILLELTPALIKLIAGKSQYDKLLRLVEWVNERKMKLVEEKWKQMSSYDNEVMYPLVLPSFDFDDDPREYA